MRYIFYSLNIRILFLNFGKIIFFFLIIPGIYYNSQITYISLMSLFCINTYIILDTRHHQSSSLKPLTHPLHVFHKYKFDNFIDLKWLAISSSRRGNKHINQYHGIKQKKKKKSYKFIRLRVIKSCLKQYNSKLRPINHIEVFSTLWNKLN